MFFMTLRSRTASPPWRLATAVLAGTTLTACGPDAADAPASAPAALSVMTQPVRYSDELTRRDTLTGRIEANRRSDVGFELGGQLVEVIADEGDTVSQGDVLARLDTARLKARRAEVSAGLSQAEAQAALAQTTLTRMREALSFDGVSQQEIDEASNALASANAAVAAAKSRQYSVDVDVAKSTLRAPYDARITARHADEGQVLQPGQPVLSLQERRALILRVGIAGDAIDELVPGSTHRVEVGERVLPAVVRQVLPQRDAVARTVDALLELPDDDALRVGDLARLTLSQPVLARGVWLPLDALAEGRRGLWTVYVAAPEAQSTLGATHQVTSRPVEIVHQDGQRAFVRGPLEDGEAVIVGGLQRIVPGQYVRIDQTVAQQ